MAEDDPTTVPQKRRRPRRKAANPLAGEVAAPVPVVPSSPRAQSAPAVVEDGASLEADRVEIRMSAVGRIEGGDVSVGQGVVGAVRADHLAVDRSGVGAVLADRVEISRGYARSILARQVQLDRGAARVVVAADVRAQQSAVMFLVARRVSGEMRVLFDWRGALAFGAAAGLVFALLARVRRRPR